MPEWPDDLSDEARAEIDAVCERYPLLATGAPRGPSALQWLLSDDDEVYLHRDDDGTPLECQFCGWAQPEAPPPDTLEDLVQLAQTATHFHCHLLNRPHVDGLNPVCRPRDWHARARAELSRLRTGLLEFGWHKPSCRQVEWMQASPRPSPLRPGCDCGLAERLAEVYRALGLKRVEPA